jgi:hypothetical protein
VKKIGILVLIFVVFFIFGSVVFAKSGVVTTDGLNMRDKPLKDSDIIRSVGKGKIVEILDESGDFYKVLYSGRVGYLSRQFVDVSDGKTDNSNDVNKVSENFVSGSDVKVENKISNDNKNQVDSNVIENANTNDSSKNVNVTVGNYKLLVDSDLYVLPVLYSLKNGFLKKGETVDVLTVTPYWIFVSNGKISGWIFKNTVSLDYSNKIMFKDNKNDVTDNRKKDNNNSGNDLSDDMVSVNTDSVNVREEPSTTSDILASASKGRKLKVLKKSGEWTQVQFNNVKGYILSKFLSK